MDVIMQNTPLITFVECRRPFVSQDVHTKRDHGWPAHSQDVLVTCWQQAAPSLRAIHQLCAAPPCQHRHLLVMTNKRVPTTSATQRSSRVCVCAVTLLLSQARISCSSAPAGDPTQVAAKPAVTADARCTGRPSSTP